MPAQSGLSAFSRENMMAVLKKLSKDSGPYQPKIVESDRFFNALTPSASQPEGVEDK